MASKSVTLMRRLSWLDWLGLGTLGLTTALIFADYAAGDPRRWLALGVSAAILAVFVWQDIGQRSRRKAYMGLGLVTFLVAALMFLGANLTAVIILLFIVAGAAMAELPVRQGYLWIGVLGLLTAGYTINLLGPQPLAVMMALGCFAGYVFIGSAVDAQRRAEQARAESQRLLYELEIAHRRLQDSARQAEALAVAEERNRLAREVHDTLGHRLTVAAVQLEGAQRLIERDPAKAARMVATVREQVVDGLGELRRTVAALRTPLETELSLPAAIARLAQSFADATDIALHMTLPDTMPEPTADQRDALFRTVQEGLTNVQRHATASEVWVCLAGDAHGVSVAVEDNGRGFQAEKSSTGYGLHGLAERAGRLGGHFAAGPSRHGGASISLSLPREPQPDAVARP